LADPSRNFDFGADMTNHIQLPVAPQGDSNGDELRALLTAHLAAERTRAARELWIHLSAIIGALIILLPQATPHARAALLALWGVAWACTIVAAAFEWRWRWREAQLLAANHAASRA